jgi:hypothetical protein
LIAAERWRDNPLAVGRPGAVRVELARGSATRKAQARLVRDLPSGSPVLLSASAPGARRRCRTFAAKAGVTPEREYLALPSAAAPAYLVEDAPAAVEVLVRTVLVPPPGSALTAPIGAALGIIRALGPWRLMRTLAPGRVIAGRRR